MEHLGHQDHQWEQQECRWSTWKSRNSNSRVVAGGYVGPPERIQQQKNLLEKQHALNVKTLTQS